MCDIIDLDDGSPGSAWVIADAYRAEYRRLRRWVRRLKREGEYCGDVAHVARHANGLCSLWCSRWVYRLAVGRRESQYGAQN